MRYVIALGAAVAFAAAGRAHFVFVYVEGAEARLVFGHKAEPDPKASAARAEKTALTARTAGGKELKLTTEKGDGSFYRAKLPEAPAVVFGTTEAGVTQRGDDPPLLSFYYPKVVVGDPFAKGLTAGTALELVPVKDGGKVRFQVLVAGKPVEGVEVTVGLPGETEEKSPVVKTDKDGLTESFAAKGRYCVAARRAEAKPGEFAGKKYSAVRHTATLVLDLAK
ncbi:Nickel uptake substrate-specific transmembrane region [Gemmata obscuriglobus]|uniref:DUF4198 domain-containing protein n=1 Tax=Gemmata obscuriglobus TaxID=114 RepID=A0A2Z3H7J5_9BACT|nr:DUF4198 domain-containing protein [Gemmata obscuriglobus]AWM40362.1 DUF4198 domain-containing protein [Gemmata obscuriglobus]QEG26417.1 Nickel uptake substrate-specific transmembrane region [Gemmata obscuriglobus]VTS01540.1 Uncharacterized protein OS=Phycisphaera mikurensis (strain NBRC 102666 / KCTC 22515 / FYK2301M01) GN=PSMK_26110 PE=4 SV=1: DUF4198 [Gemmata obscuriglobus UQM 2246]